MNRSQFKAVRIADAVLKNLKFAPGQSEKEVAAEIVKLLKRFGAYSAFRIIVASGKRSARPHAFASHKIIRPGEVLKIDFGAVYNGWRSDITRTFFMGRPTAKQKRIYNIVKRAQAKAIKTVRAGRVVKLIDQAARDYIKRWGFGKYFIHTTGHGIGKKVHQAPKISFKNRRRLKAGQVITVEPGIYIKGWGGIRIEDMVLVTEKGGRVLTKAPK